MEESLDTAAIATEVSRPSLSVKIDFSRLKSYFDRLDRKLKDLVLRTINDDVTLRVQFLVENQETLSEKCHAILGRFFGASIVENPEVAVDNWEEAAALKLLLRWFTFEEKEVERMLNKIIGDRFMSVAMAEEPIIVQVSAWEAKEVFDQESGRRAKGSVRKEAKKTVAEGREDGDSSDHAMIDDVNVKELKDKIDKRMDRNSPSDDHGDLSRILSRAKKLDHRISNSLPHLFFLLKKHDRDIQKITLLKPLYEWALEEDETPPFVVKVIELLRFADEELDRVKRWWKIEGILDHVRDLEELSNEFTSVIKLLVKLHSVVVNLVEFEKYRLTPDPRQLAAVDIASLENTLEVTEAELDGIEARLDELKAQVKDGCFTGTVVELVHVIRCIRLD